MKIKKKSIGKVLSIVMATCMISFLFSANVLAEGETGNIQVNGLTNMTIDENECAMYYNAQGTNERAGYLTYYIPNGVTYEGPREEGGQQAFFLNDISPGNVTFNVNEENGYKLDSVTINGNGVEISDVQGNKSFEVPVTAGQPTIIQPQFSKNDSGNGNVNNTNISVRIEGDAVMDGIPESPISVLYSLDSGGTWKAISQDTVKDGSVYTFPNTVNSIQLKTTWTSGDYMLQSLNLVGDGSIDKDEVTTISQFGEYNLQIDHEVFTVVWTYDDPRFPEDAWVKHGKVIINPGVGINGNADSHGGYYVITPGTQVTAYFIPDYGYQFKHGGLNGTPMVAGSGISSFTFIMPQTQLHLSALFTESSDIVDINNTQVQSAKIENPQEIVDSGNLKLSIDTPSITMEEQQKMQEQAAKTGSKIENYMDISASNFLYKGDTDNTWNTNLAELDVPMSITLKLSDELTDSNKTYSVVRKHGSEYTNIPAVYNEENGTITFETNRFSDYAVASKPIKTDADKRVVKTNDDFDLGLYRILILISVLGMFAMVIRAKRKTSVK